MTTTVRITRDGHWTVFRGTNDEVRGVANILGRAWNKDPSNGARANVALGLYPSDVAEAIAKLEAVGCTVNATRP